MREGVSRLYSSMEDEWKDGDRPRVGLARWREEGDCGSK